MKVSGQFQNVERAEDYANIRSYIETCRLYGKNECDSLRRLVEGNPYTFAKLLKEHYDGIIFHVIYHISSGKMKGLITK